MLAENKDVELINLKLEELIIDKRRYNQKIFLFGCTKFSQNIIDFFVGKGVSIQGFCDNNPNKIGTKCMGYPIVSPNFLLRYASDEVLIIVCSKYGYEMKEQLLELGFKEDNILDIAVSERVFYDDSDEAFCKAKNDVKAGFEIYFNITNKYNCKNLMLCPYPGTGDIYMACRYLEAYCRKEEISKYVLTVCSKSCEQVAKMFSIENVEIISIQEKDNLLKAWEYAGEIIQIKPLLYWGWRTKKYLYATNHPQITFNEMFLYDVFNLDKGVKVSVPNKTNTSYAKKLFEDNNLKPGKTVILAPYAGSFIYEMKESEWEEVTRRLIEMGYSVCTNCDGVTEKPIKGTTHLFCPYSQIISVVEYAGYFVGVRSGLCDVISSSSCNMLVIYDNGFAASDIKYFGINKMGLSNRVIDVVYSANTIVDKIVDFCK